MPRRSMLLWIALGVVALGVVLAWLATRGPGTPVDVADARRTSLEAKATGAEPLEGTPRTPDEERPSEAVPAAAFDREPIEPAAPRTPEGEERAERRTVPLRVRVVDQDGMPITTYRLTVDRFLAAARKVDVASIDGRCSLEVRPGRWTVSVSADGHLTPSGQPEASIRVQVQTDTDELVFVLQQAATLAGRVVDPFGNSVPGANVSIRTREGLPFLDFGPRNTETSDDLGTFEVVLLPGPRHVSASADGWAPSTPVTVHLDAGTRTDAVLRLTVGGSLSGEVLGGGRPVPGVEVGVFSLDRGGSAGTRTDRHGHFELLLLAAGEYEIMSEDGEGTPLFAHCRIEDGERTHVVLGGTADDAVLVRGRIRASGRPHGGFELVAVREGVKLFEGLASADVAGDGTFQITLAGPGHHLFFSEDESTFFGRVDIPDRREFDLVLDVPVGRIAGDVHGPDGPLAKATVRIHARGLPFSVAESGGTRTTDEDGRYAFEDLPAGLYTLVADDEIGSDLGRAVLDGVELPAGSSIEADLELVPGTVLAGRVLDAVGRPVPGAMVTVQSTGGTVLVQKEIETDAAGRFRSEPLGPGIVRVFAAAPKSVSRTATIRLAHDAEVELRLGPIASLKLAALDADGRPVRATFWLRDEQGHDHAGAFDLGALKRMFTDGLSSSSLTVDALAPGRYEAGARSSDGREARLDVTLEAGDERRVELVLD